MSDSSASPGFFGRMWRAANRPSVRYSLLMLAGGGFIAGIVFWGGFNTAMEATNTMGFCTSCHEMRDNVYAEYKNTIHATNRTGVRATCSDCHVPKDWTHKIIRKMQASNELLHKVLGSVDTKEKFDAKRLTLARNEWARMKGNDSTECRNCHGFEAMNPENQRPRARKQHLAAMEVGNTCIDCHKGIAHKNVRSLVPDAELEAMEKPVAAYIRDISPEYKDGLARAEAREKEIEAKQKAVLAEAVQAALADAKAKSASAAPAGAAAAAPAGGGASGAAGGPINWDGVESKTLGFFYPGQASYEWVVTGKEHGGARAFVRGGDRCVTCHDKEVRDMGAKIVSGAKAETTPIPNKRGSVDVKVQTAHDANNVYFRFQWAKAPHTPVPFVEGGKMDQQNEAKLSIMISGAGVDNAQLAGCWMTCHADARSMPDAPKTEALKGAPQASLIDLANGVTKYINESRTAIETKEAPRGGWDKLKGKDEIAALPGEGKAMELMRWRSAGEAEHGLIVADRKMTGLSPIKATGGLDGQTYTVVISRPLKGAAPGEVTFEPGKKYIVSFALHEDFTAARFHHVSLSYEFAIDGEGEIIAKKQ
jgi:nitrate/TMAO reductase-like tetraheme cytochrome c subunit